MNSIKRLGTKSIVACHAWIIGVADPYMPEHDIVSNFLMDSIMSRE